MAMLSLHNIRIAFGGPVLLENVSVDIHKGQRISFLGRNGAGKSTLMKIMAGTVRADSGEIIALPGLRIAYLPQEVPDELSGNVYDIVASGAGEVGVALAAWHRMVAGHHDPQELQTLQHTLDINDGWKIQTSVNRVLEQVSLDADVSFGSLSGGMKRRALLARALVCEPDLLLLDEPTNHLDIESITWLESFILSSRLTVLFVTHDRRLLKRIATRIIELDRGKLVDWTCDYETFLVRKQAMLDAEEKDWERFDKKLAQEEVWIRRGIKARRTRNEGRVRVLQKMREERRKRRERSGAVSMAASQAGRSGERVIEAVDICFSYNNIAVIKNFSTAIGRGDHIGIIGPNGCGKTTLIKLLLGLLAPQQGIVKFGTNLSIVHFDQLRQVLEPTKSVWENVAPGGADTVFVNGVPKHVISYLQDFLFTSDRAKSPVKQLSGGERNRLMLARLFTQPANVMVFDEPTNDLDAETLELLEEILVEYTGTVLVVSHDREFLNNVVTATLVYEGEGRFKEYNGGYDDWERVHLEQLARRIPNPPAPKKAGLVRPVPVGQGKLSYKESRELEQLPVKIDTLEKEHEGLCMKMADPKHFSMPGFINEARLRIVEIEKELSETFGRWEELEARVR